MTLLEATEIIDQAEIVPTEKEHETMTRALIRLQRRSTYQQDVILRRESVRGTDLAGKARRYESRYRESRQIACNAWVASGGHIRRAEGGELRLETGKAPVGSSLGYCSMGACYDY